jgi:trans-2-enoyl-CoA reductase
MNQPHPVVIIGGTPRVINQVKSLKKTGKLDGQDKTVGEILKESRADKLLNKELQKQNLDIVEKLTTGNLTNSFVELPNVNWRKNEFHKVKGAFEIAQNIELDYAKQASSLFKQ